MNVNVTTVARDQLSEELIEVLVRAFYTRIQKDAVLGPIFDAHIGDQWEPHLQRMFAFWSSLMLTSGRYKGQPMVVHQRLHEVKPAHFEVWLALFSETAFDVCAADIAQQFIDKAERVAKSLQLAMFYDPAIKP